MWGEFRRKHFMLCSAVKYLPPNRHPSVSPIRRRMFTIITIPDTLWVVQQRHPRSASVNDWTVYFDRLEPRVPSPSFARLVGSFDAENCCRCPLRSLWAEDMAAGHIHHYTAMMMMYVMVIGAHSITWWEATWGLGLDQRVGWSRRLEIS